MFIWLRLDYLRLKRREGEGGGGGALFNNIYHNSPYKPFAQNISTMMIIQTWWNMEYFWSCMTNVNIYGEIHYLMTLLLYINFLCVIYRYSRWMLEYTSWYITLQTLHNANVILRIASFIKYYIVVVIDRTFLGASDVFIRSNHAL